jgi:hypothetical protein
MSSLFCARGPHLWRIAAVTSAFFAACVVTTDDSERLPASDDGGVIDDDGAFTTAGVTTTGGMEPWCFEGGPSNETVAICDDLNVTPSEMGGPASLCVEDGETFDPYGYSVCQLGFTFYEPAHAERLAACLSTIETFEACSFEPVQECLDLTFEEACNSPGADALCLDIFEDCAASGESFDYDLCSYELRLFDAGALGAFEDCFAGGAGNCSERYEACFAGLATLE